MHTFKLTNKQRLKLLQSGLSLKKIEDIILETIPDAKTLKICFSDQETLEWLKDRYPPKNAGFPPNTAGIQGLFDWWASHAKAMFRKPSMTGLYYAYDECRKAGKPFVMPARMAKDDRAHKIY